MKKFAVTLSLAVACASLSTPAVSAIRSASFQTSLTILESCRVDGGVAVPVVSCQLASSASVMPASRAAVADGGPAWVVTF